MPIQINNEITIPDDDLTVTFSRSSGPGGQNVNKVNSRVILYFDLSGCRSLTDSQKNRIRKHLSGRIDKQGRLRIICQIYRTQSANRNAAVERLVELLAKSLEKRKVRKKTTIPAGARRKRLEAKKQRGHIKKLRGETFTRHD
jgi:ribosome-associated protein